MSVSVCAAGTCCSERVSPLACSNQQRRSAAARPPPAKGRNASRRERRWVLYIGPADRAPLACVFLYFRAQGHCSPGAKRRVVVGVVEVPVGVNDAFHWRVAQALESLWATTAAVGDESVLFLCVVPDQDGRFPCVRDGQVGLEEAFTLAAHVRAAIAEDRDKPREAKRPIIAILTSRARLTGGVRRRPASFSRRLRRQMHTHRHGWRDILLFPW